MNQNQMKEDKNLDTTINSCQTSLFNSLSQSNFLKENALKCVANKVAVQMCLNQKCKHRNVFQCLNQNCQCREIHQRCKEGKSKCVIKMVTQKIASTQQIVQVVNQLIDRKIDQLSELRQTLISKIEKDFKYVDLNESETKFLQLLKGEGKIEDFTSAESKMIWQLSNLDVSTQKSGIQLKIDPFLKQFDQSVSKSISELKNRVNSLVQEKQKQKIVSPLQLEIMKSSAICTDEQLSSRFIKIFERKISKLTYLFRASQNDFSIKKYFDICGEVQNTVIMCKTNKDKIIGGYSPLAHQYKSIDGYVCDSSGESFLFSLSDQQKFVLKQNSGAIYRRTNKERISFGANQFDIYNNKNTIGSGRSYVNREYYYCPAYSQNDKAAYLKFNGNQSCDFTIKEWEVWKVQF